MSFLDDIRAGKSLKKVPDNLKNDRSGAVVGSQTVSSGGVASSTGSDASGDTGKVDIKAKLGMLFGGPQIQQTKQAPAAPGAPPIAPAAPAAPPIASAVPAAPPMASAAPAAPYTARAPPAAPAAPYTARAPPPAAPAAPYTARAPPPAAPYNARAPPPAAPAAPYNARAPPPAAPAAPYNARAPPPAAPAPPPAAAPRAFQAPPPPPPLQPNQGSIADYPSPPSVLSAKPQLFPDHLTVTRKPKTDQKLSDFKTAMTNGSTNHHWNNHGSGLAVYQAPSPSSPPPPPPPPSSSSTILRLRQHTHRAPPPVPPVSVGCANTFRQETMRRSDSMDCSNEKVNLPSWQRSANYGNRYQRAGSGVPMERSATATSKTIHINQPPMPSNPGSYTQPPAPPQPMNAGFAQPPPVPTSNTANLAAEFEKRFNFLTPADLPPPPEPFKGSRTYFSARRRERHT